MLKPNRILAAAFASCLLWAGATTLAPRSARAQIGDEFGLSPHWDWKTIESEHFRIVFPVELEKVAQKTARYYEEAFAALHQKLFWNPSRKTQVVLVDNADAANGLASATLRLGMVLILTPPDPYFSTAHYDDWLKLLVFHEYTHFLNMDATEDFWKTLRFVFGDLPLPNAAWPSWMLEGLAVYMETRYTGAGRGRSPYYEMILRTAVEKDVLGKPEFVTLDRINGPYPYYPAGEVPYLFGYQLMNQVARTASKLPEQRTADQRENLAAGDDALGIMSIRSAGRVPYFINGNLQNITGKDWYDYWKDFVSDTQARMTRDLETIRSEPVTPMQILTERGHTTYGSAVSPDGKWIAYTSETLDHRTALYLRELGTGKTRRLTDKILGGSLSFTPDSKKLVFSGLTRESVYVIYSDLGTYDLESGETHWLTEGLRARDPTVSPDGKWVAFTLTETATTGLAVAPLELEDGRLKLGEVRKIYMPAMLDRVSTPKFSPDSKKIAFSFHPNGHAREDLIELDLESGKTRELLQNGDFNRYPAYHPDGSLYFVSNASGVENVYRLAPSGRAEQRTNVTTGLWFPTFAPSGELYATAFTLSGWEIARVDLSASPIDTGKVTVQAPPAPEPIGSKPSSREPQQETTPAVDFPVQDYSSWPSILPRAWAPLVPVFASSFPAGVFVGGQVIGFDALDRHNYVLGLGVDTQIQKLDWLLSYSNRSLGPTISLTGWEQTNQVEIMGDELIAYIRERNYEASISYPFEWTYSSLTPALGIQAEREYLFVPSLSDSALRKSRYVPSADFTLTYSNTESSRLAITTEGGRVTRAGARIYHSSGISSWKGFVADTEHFRVTDHSVLVPAIKASYSTRASGPIAATYVNVEGRVPSLSGGLASSNLSQLTLRGYPGFYAAVRGAAVGSADYRFPVARIYRGAGTLPAYLDKLHGFVFAESAYIPEFDPGFTTLPSVGGGLRLDSLVFHYVPLNFSLEYHLGLKEELGGRGEVIFSVNAGSLFF